jgi:hypothetical protein
MIIFVFLLKNEIETVDTGTACVLQKRWSTV